MKSFLKVVGCCIIAYLIWISIVFLWGIIFVKETTDTVMDAGKEIVNSIQVEAQKGDITLAEYNQIKVGMTYSQVVQIIGTEGTFSSETQIGNYNYKYYTWNGVGVGASATISFYNNTVYSKSQFNLK